MENYERLQKSNTSSMMRKKRHHYHHRKKNMGEKAFKGILERSKIFKNLRRIEEDILKYILEQNQQKINILKLKQVFRKINGDLEHIIDDLINKMYITKQNNFLFLSPSGNEIAELISRIHDEIEEFIKNKNLSCNAHQMAHILEHELTEEQVEIMIKATEIENRGVSMPNFKFSSGMIVKVDLENCEIWTKIVSIGIFPGQRIHIINNNYHNYLVEVKNSKFAIDRNLAEAIFLLP